MKKRKHKHKRKYLLDELVEAAQTSTIVLIYLKRMQIELKVLDVDKKGAYLVGRTQQKEQIILDVHKIIRFSVLNSFSQDNKTTGNQHQQEQSKELNLIDDLTPPLTNEKEHKSSIEMEINLTQPSSNDKSVKLNDPNYTQIITPPLANEKEHKSSIEMETNLTQPSSNDKSVKLNDPNYTQIITPPLANEKTHTPIPTKNVSIPTENDNKAQSNGLDPIQTRKEHQNKRTNNDVTISIGNKNGNSIIS